MKWFVLFATVTFSVAALSGGYSVEDTDSVQRILLEVEERSKSLPDDPYSLYQEREWATSQISTFSYSRLYGNNYDKDTRRFNELREQFAQLKQAIERYDVSSDIADIRATWTAYASLIRRAETSGRPFGYTDSDEFYNLAAYYNAVATGRDLKDPGTTKEMILSALKDEKLALLLETYLQYALSEINAKAAEQKKLDPAITSLLAKLEAYKKSISGAISSQETKEKISANLFLLISTIGLLSIGAIALVRLFPEAVMTEWVASGQVIQFVTVMILLSAIMVLGLSGLLSENTIGTLLGGIGGYVLSQGVGRSVARKIEKAKEES